MHITIHRGIDQIGGCICEIATDTSRVFIDMGDNLPGTDNLSDSDKDAFVTGLFARNRKEHEAVFYTHAHGDHVGMLANVPSHVAQYMSEAGRSHLLTKFSLLNTIADPHIHHLAQTNLAAVNKAEIISNDTRIIGNIAVRAIAVPHSAHGSVMYLIEADGKRIIHTGDFKRKGVGLDLIEQLRGISPINVVITEGTMLNRSHAFASETEVCCEMVKVMRRHKYIYVLTSSLNSDRIASVSQAAMQCRKPLTVCSSMMQHAIMAYQKENPAIFGKYVTFYPIPHPHTSAKTRKFHGMVARNGFVQCVGLGQLANVSDQLTNHAPDECALIYSVWSGYYRIARQVSINPGYTEFRKLFAHVYDIHSGGHADADTIAEMLTTLNPTDAIIGIHKEPDTSLLTLNLPAFLKTKIVPDSQLPPYITIK